MLDETTVFIIQVLDLMMMNTAMGMVQMMAQVGTDTEQTRTALLQSIEEEMDL